ncbi:MAG TPA: tetratricopeptide repeat protein [Steroidobacteraceae bacterium]|nr:tetratricopeptide repeat protein [Steroidobacteraceae bacterium]
MLEHDRKIAAILAADVVEYSRLMGADEEFALAELKQRRATFDRLVAEYGGREFGSVGDSLMAEFPSAVNAVRCALAIQRRTEDESSTLPPTRRMRLRIGVNLGDVIEERGSAFGDAVNVAARLQSLAKPGGVLISGTVYDQVRDKVPARFIDAGKRQVKNVKEPVRTFEVLVAEPSGTSARVSGFLARVAPRRVRRAAMGVIALVAAAALGLLWRELSGSRTAQRIGSVLGSRDVVSTFSIAVLPFVNMSGDPRNDYLGDGLSEELSNRLTKIPELRVAARTSAFAFKNKGLDVSQIAEKLGVAYVLQGSVKRQADRFRVTAQLVEAATGSNSWSNAYQSESHDPLAIEEELAARVITALKIVLGEQEALRVRQPRTGSPLAYDLRLQGLAYLRGPKSVKTLEAAEELFERALAEQPTFARAQAGLCETRVQRYLLEKIPAYVVAAEEACANAAALDSDAQEVHMAVGTLSLAKGNAVEAEASYRLAIALAPNSPDALIGLAEALAAGGETAEAESTFQRAIATQSSYASAHLQYGNFLFSQGRATEAVPEYESATVLTPDNPHAFSNLGGAYLLMGNFEKAADAFARSLALEPRRASYANTGIVHYYLGRYSEAADMFRKAIEFAPADHRLWGNLADALLYDSRPDEATLTYRRALELVDGELAVNPKHAVNQAQAAYYATRLHEKDRARRSIAIALSEEEGNVYVHYYVALAELGLGDASAAVAHAKRARELGYAQNLMEAAPELADIRKQL